MDITQFFINPYKIRTDANRNIFFVSDTHFGHARDFIYTKRGYASVIEHDTGIIDKWNKKVTNNDVVFHCGDVMFGEGGLERLENYFQNLKFKELFLMPGNHHAGIKQFMSKYGHENIYMQAVMDLKNMSLSSQTISKHLSTDKLSYSVTILFLRGMEWRTVRGVSADIHTGHFQARN